MNDRGKRPGKSLALPTRSDDYKVGYGKPPVATRFRPGQSGNPNGRRKGTTRPGTPALNDERLKTIILEEAYRTININDQTGQIDIPMAQKIVFAFGQCRLQHALPLVIDAFVGRLEIQKALPVFLRRGRLTKQVANRYVIDGNMQVFWIVHECRR